MTTEFKKNNPTLSQIETPKPNNGSSKPAEIERKPECQKKHPTNDGKRKR